MRIGQLYVEAMKEPLGIDVARPAFRWSFAAPGAERCERQTAYRLIVASRPEDAALGIGELWDSGRRTSGSHAHVRYEGSPLESRTRYYWRVEIWDQAGVRIVSDTAWFEMGLLEEADWQARWIGAALTPEDAPAHLPLFREEFQLEQQVRSARVYVSGLGHYELRLNGCKIGNRVLEPGWTQYNRTCLYSVYDVTEALQAGPNAIGIMLGNGFYHIPGGRYRKFNGSFGIPVCRVQLEAVLADGSRVTISSSRSWRTSPGPLTFSCIYGGEDYDARLEQPGWDCANYMEMDSWGQAAEPKPPAGAMKAQMLAPLKTMRTFRPLRYTEPFPGVYVADLGQNFSGWVEVAVSGPAGAVITLSPAELLKADGTANQKWTGSPYRFHYTLKGEGVEIWSPRFSYYGFRYVQIEGATPVETAGSDTGGPILHELKGQMIYPDTETKGSFACSDELLNRTHSLINYAILSNMKSIFTDCPHREKLGWLEQVHLMGPSVAFNYDIERLLVKTMEDIRDAQLPSGMLPTTAPEYVVFSEEWRCFRDSVSWGAAYVLTGWNLLQWYGNRRMLEEHYAGMRAYIEYVTDSSKGYLVDFGLGDWYDVGEQGPGFVQNTPIAHTETAMYYQMVDVFLRISELLGHSEDVVRYGQLREGIKEAFNAEFFDPEAIQYATGSQTSNAMPLVLGLVEEQHREAVLSRLVADIRRHGTHTTAGDVGHRYVLLALARHGLSDLIYEMARQTEHPSYGYQLQHGATALTEAWDGPTVGKSQNHFMLGHIEEWFYTGIAGISYRFKPATDTYELKLRPCFLEGMDSAEASHQLPCGTVRIAWKRSQKGTLTLAVDIPVNCSAELHIPADSLEQLTESGLAVTESDQVSCLRLESGHAVLRLGSGSYRFENERLDVKLGHA
ncbi:alpha-L-rhamnosidase [Paenibacillus puerhi]|uniref:alpha-L-rhamnosidase n=1 Tax=Paenibacillus puerhi TaxID=2692622 RepID=UPI00135B19D4|nr:alpha-L-rhamnosidase [Paenibacillus puerhi]